ncbi:MAG: YlbF family regulator [Enterococcus sp.]
MTNIYDTANQLEREIRESAPFGELKASFEKLKQDEASFAIFKEFQVMQQELQTKMMAGEAVTDEEAVKAQAMAEKVQSEALINDLMQKEQAFSTIINDLNNIIMSPVRDLYGN